METSIEAFFSGNTKWHKEFEKLRNIALDCGLIEDLKWGKPCYLFQNSNIVLIHGFKEYCAFLFFKGALLNDANEFLVQQTKNVQAGRQIRFTNINEIKKLEPILKAYLYEAIEIEKSGLKINFKETKDYEVPEEFQNILAENIPVKCAFEALSPGRQRAYYFFFSQAKQSKTRISRIEKCLAQILEGKGLND